MILGDPHGTHAPDLPGHRDAAPTLDDLFRRAVGERPGAVALIDPPDRASFTDGLPRRLTWVEADGVVSAIANLLKSFGLPADAIVALHLANTVDSVLALMGVLRAGLIAAPLPLLWRQSEACAALGRVGARTLIACRRVGGVDHGELAMHVAAETFAIRFVCVFGSRLPDGVIPLDDVFDEALPAQPPPLDRTGDPADHLAVVTFDNTADGMVPVARSHAELIAAGRTLVTASGIEPDAHQLGTLMTASFAGLASTIVPWLISGGTLWLHQPFDPAVFAVQCLRHRCDVAIVPGPLLPRLIEAGLVGSRPGPKQVVAVWRAPERLGSSAAWPDAGVGLVDVAVFGETGHVASRRGLGGKPVPMTASRPDAARAVTLAPIELARSAGGTLAMRGAMVPRFPFPPGVERGDPLRMKIGNDGFVDTGYPCTVDRDTLLLTINGPPAGIVAVGGYRFALRELQGLVAPIDDNGSVAALPDVLAGHRLAGVGGDRPAIHRKLADQGANPLVTAAFRDKRPGRASAA